MYQNEFNPITFILELKLPDPTIVKRWTDITSYIIEKYAQELSKNDDVFIGHIKAIFTGGEKDYIKLSIYRKDIPVNSECSGDGTYNEIKLIINSIVHNVDEETSIRTLDQICDKCRKQFLIGYDVKLESHKEHSQYNGHVHDN
ncbi:MULTISPECIES: hypothetical protein [unclassified Dehalobacter]|jgi:hypothetical protein|uniref:hypothetical protein n=1 Tax=unclassified Dehalobacter TaxID=2635733 RepID=UPI00059C8DAA|nr:MULTISPECIES: hypothetical protein [unclassified Dehalobacter]